MKILYLSKMKYLKTNYLRVIVKILLFLLGFILSTLGIAMYISSTIGASQIDWTLYNISSIIGKYNFETGTMSDEVLKSTYILALNILYIIMVFFSFIFALSPTIKEYKKIRKNEIWFNLLIIIISDIIIAFLTPLLLNFYFKNVIILDKIMSDKITQEIRNWIFIAGFTIFCFGIALWVHSGIIMGPFNNICYQLMRLTNMNYLKSRVIIDFCIFFPGIVFWFFIPGNWNQRLLFLTKNFGIGTIAFTFIAGPYINMFLNFIKKCIKYFKINQVNKNI
ncbi:SPE_1075/MLC_0560 family membrane protein [Spiroplasma taiwanense]|uniref:Transmembrane protein n=1 Tax=Spiroplasma taiwanense CT-1 TaxID=1276220 RepID=S5LV26_9MOLU|nr:hypothetical protein [Spiroplasma taiwanense]AGR41649.1 transmembrane protein [Spiroplasma taiwanense CT-1]